METRKLKPINSFFIFKFRITPELIVEIISGLFFFLFLYAATNKLIEFEKFKAQLGQSVMLTAFSNQLVWLIPIIEIAISILLIVPRTNLLGLYASFTLMFMFTAYIALMLGFAAHISCSCGGILDKMGWSEHLIFNGVFVFLGTIGILLQSKLEQKKVPKEPH